MMMKKNLLILAAMMSGALVVNAALLYQESFDYGDVTQNIQNVSNWNTGSGVVEYDHDGGLTHVGLNDEAAGSMHHNHPSGNRGGNNTDAAFNPFVTAGQGDEFWIAALFQVNNHEGQNFVLFDNSQSVNRWGFGIDGSGNVTLYASDNGDATPPTSGAGHDTGVDAAADGSTYLFLSRGIVGSGSSPEDSIVDFWFNPSDTSSVGALGAPTFSTGADSKFGRQSGAFTSVNSNLAFGNRVDEIRFGETLEDITAIPEPGTLALVGIALGTLVLFRRRK